MGNRRRGPKTGFGKMLLSLMQRRDVHSWSHLSELVAEKTGREYSHQSISKYASGKVQAIPPEFVVAVCDTLQLDKQERLDLAEQYAYYSRPPDEQADIA